MAQDDWRIRIELPDEDGARGVLERLGLARSDADELAHELRDDRLAVSQDDNTVFVYAASGMQAEQASRIVERPPSGRPGSERMRRILALPQERLAGPGFGSEGGSRKAVRRLRRIGRNICRLLHARSA